MGVPVVLTTALAAVMSGGLAGVAGASLAAGQEYRMTLFIAGGYTFGGIVIAFIGRFRPIPVIITAFVVGGVYTAGDTLKVFYQLPAAITTLLEVVILLTFVVVEFFSRYHVTAGLRELADHPLVGEVRGVGMIGAIELAADKASRTRFDPDLKLGVRCRDHCIEKGVIIRAVRDIMVLTPPLIVTEEQIDRIVETARSALDTVARDLQQTA